MTEPIKWSDAPDRTSWGHGMMVADIAIDRDHTLTLYCEASQTAKVDAMFLDVERLRGKKWQRLTDEDIKAIIGRWGDTPIKGYTRWLFDKIEAALEERNT